MICKNCGQVIPDNAKFCTFCGTKVEVAQEANPFMQDEEAHEENYRNQTYGAYQQNNHQNYQQGYQDPNNQYQNNQYQYAPYNNGNNGQVGSKNKIAAGILGILLGSLGIHKFYLGYTQQGLIMLLVTIIGGIFSIGIAALVMEIIGLIEGITYLTKTDYDFYQTYEVGRKPWF